MWYIGGVIFLLALAIAAATARGAAERKKVKEARDAFEAEQARMGREAAVKNCPHAFVQFGQTGTPGIATTTTKWCRVCGAKLGPAKLKESFFANRWE